MNYNLIAITDENISSFVKKMKQNLKTASICEPGFFLPDKNLFNTHLFGCNYFFKLSNSSKLNYLVIEVSQKDQIILSSLVNQFKAGSELLHKTENNLKLGQIELGLITWILMLLHLDLVLGLIFYIVNFKKYEAVGRVKLLNITTLIACFVSLLNLNFFGFYLGEFLKTKEIVHIVPNFTAIPLFEQFVYRVIFTIVLTMASALLINKVASEDGSKVFFEKKPQPISALKI
jgi:hypothetical protein